MYQLHSVPDDHSVPKKFDEPLAFAVRFFCHPARPRSRLARAFTAGASGLPGRLLNDQNTVLVTMRS